MVSVNMLREDIFEKSKTKVMELLEIGEEIYSSDDLTFLGLDSMKSVELVVELEDLFNITFDDEELLTENFSTLEKIVDRIANKL